MRELLNNPTGSSERDKAIRLVDYLARIAQLQTKVIRSIDEYQEVLWLNDVPRQKGCFTQAWGRSEDHDSDVWIEIQGRREPESPSVPDLCKDWVKTESLHDTSDIPELLAEITVFVDNPDWTEDSEQPQSVPNTKRLEDYPKVQNEWDSFINGPWISWQNEHDVWTAIHKVYSQLFAIRQEQTRLGEEYALALGLGLLIWQSPSGQRIRRHLLVADAMLEFEAALGKFTVKPHAEGAKLRPELDMLDVGECPPNTEKMAIEALMEHDDPWEREIVDGMLKALVHSFDTQGEYESDLDATDFATFNKPVVVYAPALILRKRSAKGLTDVLQRIRERIEEGEDIPSEFLDLAEIQPTNNERASTDSSQAEKKLNDEIFFPKPSNEAQRSIVDQIRSTSGVLVQGPPGTGKSHTIANLICHLLATGKRSLITAKTPRALKVLEGLIPRELRALCINLIGSGLEERRSLESSVRGILHKYNNWNEHGSRLECKKLEDNLHQLRKEKSEVDRRLRDIREAETYPKSIAESTYHGTAARIAEVINGNKNAYGWFTDEVTEDRTCPISEDDMRRVLEGLRCYTSEKRQELKLELHGTLPSSSRWKNLIENEADTTKEANMAVNGADERVADRLSKNNRDYIESLQDALNAFLNTQRRLMALEEPWVNDVLRDAETGKTELWRDLSSVTQHAIAIIKPLADDADNTVIDNPKKITLNSLHQTATELLLHLKNGGKLTLWCILPKSIVVHRRQIKSVRINGSKPSTIQDFQDLEIALRVGLECEKAWGFWVGRVEKSQGPYQLQVRELEKLSQVLEDVLSLEEIVKGCRELIGQCTAIDEPLWSNESQVATMVASCRLAIARQRKRECGSEIRKIEEPVASLAAKSNAHPLTRKLRDAIRKRDVDGFVYAANRIQDLLNEQKRVTQLDNDVLTMYQHLPRLMAELEQTNSDPRWNGRVNQIQDAWRWGYAKYWIEKFIRQEDIPALVKRAKQIEDEIHDKIAELSALHAWSFCFSRLTKDHREHMVAWQQAMKRYGKGTGRQAWRYLREAQHHLNQCYEAVPAWVMPLHRVWDTVNPAPKMFDVIIVDEASQCGIEAMPLFFLSKKMLIVGDDKQISPEAIGLDIDDVYRLINRYLFDFKFKESFHVANSLYDYGERRYSAHRITLLEHFRCMPEIIRFSNNLCYSGKLESLRQYGPDRLPPLQRVLVDGGYREGKDSRVVNRPEADAIVKKIAELCNDSTGRYEGKSMGVVVLQGTEQARLIQTQLLEQLGARQIENRRLICGNPSDFQGDERDIIFLSMVAATSDGSDDDVRIGALARPADERRFNVAASRAKDQMYLFHSVTRNDLSENCLRRRLLEFFENTTPRTIVGIDRAELERKAMEEKRRIVKPPNLFESWFELDVALEIARKGFNVVPQYEVANRRIDLVIEGGNARLAVECDGDEWHGAEEYEADMFRQRQLERCGWEFFRVRQSAFIHDKERALEGLWRALEGREIFPTSC